MIRAMRPKDAAQLADDLKAFSHPARILVIEHLLANGKAASPTEIATLTGESLGRVSYHVRQLADRKFIKLDRTEPRRGAVEHFYKATPRARALYERVVT